jgi:hypothetical protein
MRALSTGPPAFDLLSGLIIERISSHRKRGIDFAPVFPMLMNEQAESCWRFRPARFRSRLPGVHVHVGEDRYGESYRAVSDHAIQE